MIVHLQVEKNGLDHFHTNTQIYTHTSTCEHIYITTCVLMTYGDVDKKPVVNSY